MSSVYHAETLIFVHSKKKQTKSLIVHCSIMLQYLKFPPSINDGQNDVGNNSLTFKQFKVRKPALGLERAFVLSAIFWTRPQGLVTSSNFVVKRSRVFITPQLLLSVHVSLSGHSDLCSSFLNPFRPSAHFLNPRVPPPTHTHTSSSSTSSHSGVSFPKCQNQPRCLTCLPRVPPEPFRIILMT